MLLLLTLADLAAVGPGVLNEWKQELLTDLYEHTLLLSGQRFAGGSGQRADSRAARRSHLARPSARRLAWLETQIIVLPASVLFAMAANRSSWRNSNELRKLPRRDAVAWGSYSASQQAVEYTIGTYEEITPGIFHKLTGALTSNRQQILSADINTLADGLVLDRFYVQDQDYSGQPPQARIDEICRAHRRRAQGRVRTGRPCFASCGISGPLLQPLPRPFSICPRA